MCETVTRGCSRCGRVIPPGDLGDRCPACLLDLALEPALADRPESEAARGEATPLPARRYLGNYELLAEIAHGGMGVVYRARQLGVGRLVALKTILGRALASPEARLRFQLEAAAVGRLDHPHIVSLIETGEEGGVLFLVLGLVHGQSLAELSAACGRRDRRWLRRSAGWLATVARAIHHAHQRGVLHRDLKPANVLIDEHGDPKVTDFGLAKICESDAGLTRTDAVLGSPNYMAPEQAAGPAYAVTTAADVYSLGAILYHLISGLAPFEGATAIETMRQVVDNSPVPPRRINPVVDPDLEAICHKCLEKEPGQRYATAADLAADLDGWLAGQPTRARPRPRIEHVWRWCRRNPALAALVLVTAVSFVTLLAGSLLAVHRIQQANREARTLLLRLQLEQVESWFGEGDSARGLALLAHLVRRQPDEPTLGMRLQSALDLRPLARPFTRPWLSGAEVLALAIEPSGRRAIAFSRRGDLYQRDFADDFGTTHPLNGGEPVAHAALSPDFARLAFARADGIVRVWELPGLEDPLVELRHPAPIRFLTFDPAGRILATGCEGGSVRLWNVPGGELIRPALRHPALSRAGAFSPDSRHFATGCDDGVVRLWSVASGEVERGLDPLPAGVRVIGFSPDGARLAAGTVDGQVRCWVLGDGPPEPFEWRFPAVLTDLQFSPNGELVAVAGWSALAGAQVWNTRTGQAAGPPLAHRADVTALRFSPDGRWLVTLSMDTTARVWSTQTWVPVLDPLVHVGGVVAAAWSGDGGRLATGSYAGVVWWELPGAGRGSTLLPHPAAVLAVCAIPATGRFLTIAADGWLREWDAGGAGPLRELPLPVADPASALFGPEGTVVVVEDRDNQLHVLETAGGQPRVDPVGLGGPLVFPTITPGEDALLASTFEGGLWRFPLVAETGIAIELGLIPEIRGLAISPDGNRMVTFTAEGSARVRDSRTGRPLGPSLRHEGAVEHAIFGPDGIRIATGSSDSRARVWDGLHGRLIGDPLPHNASVEGVAFAPGGRSLVTFSADGAVRIWRLDVSEPAPVVIQQPAPVRWVVVGADPWLLLTVAREGTVRAWNPRTGTPLTEPLRHPQPVRQTGIHRSGHSLWTLTEDGSLRLWPLPSATSIDPVRLADEAEWTGRMFLDRPNRFRVTSVDRWDQRLLQRRP